MHPNIQHLYDIANKPSRKVIGLMSGTSLDGLDIALCTIAGAGNTTKVLLDEFITVPYASDLKEKLLTVFSKKTVSLEQLCILNPWLALQHASMVNDALKQWGVHSTNVDLIASHGQTIYHAPKSLHPEDAFGPATLQIGDGDHIAVATGIITVSDFRQKHIAAGGEGAPLSLYGDYLLCAHETENRILLNIGGIANFTLLNAGGSLAEVFSSDTGPGNTLMDAYTRKYFEGLAYDKDGVIAKTGKINEPLLQSLKSDSFFNIAFPKTIGPELFNLEYIIQAQMALGAMLSHEDVLATLNMFTAQTISEAIKKVVGDQFIYTLYVSGGGMHNRLLMEHLQQLLPSITIKSSMEIGILPDAKEAILFALLGNEAVAGTPLLAGGNATKVATTMGKISFPN
ncbi:MAG: anhydro-N-acetylmuramic acid kinase [Chitinophagia bacterium]|jgi:anhydro-N-acetylmuramic acid kinase|nr:anhydro-N-acetylmuramic acid kinase [Chitinophagia bacterium]